MTPTQVKAVCEYLDAVADHMVHHVAEPHSRMIRYRAARDAMERAFGILPPLDLFALPDETVLVPTQTPMPDIL